MDTFREQAIALINGSYDLHIHTSPSHFPRALNDFELIAQASALEMAGVLIKSHYEPTASRASLVNMAKIGITKAYGGVVLNWPVGGLNPYAAESALKAGAVIVWMPTRDSDNSLQFGDMPGDFFRRPGISIYNDSGKLLPQIYEIFEVMKKYGGHLATGHLSAEESVVLCKAGCDAGVRMILTHPDWNRTKVPVDIQAELADMGVLVEKNWMNIADNTCTVEEMLVSIRQVGAEHIYLATDRGQKGAEFPAQGMLRFIELLLQSGFTSKEIRTMCTTVPKQIVDAL